MERGGNRRKEVRAAALNEANHHRLSVPSPSPPVPLVKPSHDSSFEIPYLEFLPTNNPRSDKH